MNTRAARVAGERIGGDGRGRWERASDPPDLEREPGRVCRCRV